MSDTRVAIRYAEALMESAQERHLLDEILHDIQLLRGVIRDSREFRLFLSSPVISIEKKRAIVDRLFADQLHGITSAFLHMLIEKGREDILPGILTQFSILHDEMLGIVSVEVKTAVPFSGEQQKALTAKLEDYTEKKIRITYSLDKSIKGGFIARIGDTVFDASVRRQLERLRERFVLGAPERN